MKLQLGTEICSQHELNHYKKLLVYALCPYYNVYNVWEGLQFMFSD